MIDRKEWDALSAEEKFRFACDLDYLVERYQEVMRTIPECPSHGSLCTPHAIEWIESVLEETAKQPEYRVSTMKLFVLVRDNDLTGISGTGIVAQGVVLPSGKVVMEWRQPFQSIGIYPGIEDVEAIHGHNGATKIVFHNNPLDVGQNILYSSDGWYDVATGERINTQELGRQNMEGRE